MIMQVRIRCPECFFEQDIGVDEKVDMGFIPEIAKANMRCICLDKIPKLSKNTPIEKSMVSINGVPIGHLKALTQSKAR